MPNIEVQPREAQLILDQLQAHLRGGTRLHFIPKLEAQVIIGFIHKLRKIAETPPTIHIEVTVLRCGSDPPE